MNARRWSLAGSGTVIDGAGAITELGRVLERCGAHRPLLLTNRSLATSRVVGRVGESIPGGPAATFAAIRANAPADDIRAAVALAGPERVDSIVAVGGSSVTDAAKIVSLRLGEVRRESDRAGAVPPTVLIPTTLSSGELTPAAGTTGEVDREKTYVVDPRMAPSVVVLDPEATLETPAELWLSSGVKAVDHACEALWATAPHPYSDALAGDALRRLIRSLPACASDLHDVDARLDAQIGGWFSMAGMTRHGPGPSHLLGHQLAARFDVAHGITSCVTLPAVAAWAARESRPGVAAVAQTFGVGLDDVGEALDAFVARLGLPRRLRQVGGRADELDAVADAAFRHGRSVGFDPPHGAMFFRELLDACW